MVIEQNPLKRVDAECGVGQGTLDLESEDLVQIVANLQALGNSLNFSDYRCPHLSNGNISNHALWVLVTIIWEIIRKIKWDEGHSAPGASIQQTELQRPVCVLHWGKASRLGSSYSPGFFVHGLQPS